MKLLNRIRNGRPQTFFRAFVVFLIILTFFVGLTVSAVYAGAKSGELEEKVFKPTKLLVLESIKAFQVALTDMDNPETESNGFNIQTHTQTNTSTKVTTETNIQINTGKTTTTKTTAPSTQVFVTPPPPAPKIDYFGYDSAASWWEAVQKQNQQYSEDSQRQFEAFDQQAQQNMENFKLENQKKIEEFKQKYGF